MTFLRIGRTILFIMLGLVMTAAAAKAAGVVVVEGPWVTLGDVTGAQGSAGSIRVAESPAPGERIVISTAHIAGLAQANGIAWDSQGQRGVAVERASVIIPRADILAAIQHALRGMSPSGNALRPEISGTEFVLHVPVGVAPVIALEHLDYDSARSTFTAYVITPGESGVDRRTTIRGRVNEVTELPVLANPVAVGAVIRQADVAFAEVPITSVRAGIAASPNQLVGMSPRRPIRVNEAVRLSDVQAPVIVSRGQTVVMVVSSPGLQLTAAGKALANAGLGDTVQVVNSQTHATVEGIVEAPGVVRVPMARSFLAAAQR